jgi:hypothetical protein
MSLLACAAATKRGTIYKGRYFQNFETSAFSPSGKSDTWCVNAAEMAKATVSGSPSSTADVVVRGELSPQGHYCNLGASKHILKVYEVIEVSNLRAGN